MAIAPEDKTFDPQPWHFQGSDCAAILGISKSAFSERGYEPDAQVGRSKYYDLRSIIRADLVGGLVEVEAGEVIDIEAERARLTKARRIAQELDNYERSGLLAPVEVFASSFNEFCGEVCQTLEGLPGDIRRADPEISARSLEVVEVKVAEFRNLAAHKCERLSQSVGGTPSAADA